jgi:hypothetical protein
MLAVLGGLAHRVFDVADPVNLDANHITSLQVLGWLEVNSHADRCTGGNDVAGVECDARGKGFDQGGDVENQLGGAGILAFLAIYKAANAGVGAVAFVCADQPRPHGAEGVKRLAHLLLVRRAHQTERVYLEFFVEELARASGKDSLAFRQALMQNHPKYLAVLNAIQVATGKPVRQRSLRGQGFTFA